MLVEQYVEARKKHHDVVSDFDRRRGDPRGPAELSGVRKSP